MNITASYDSLPKWVKLIVQLFLGYIVSALYRIAKYLETKNVVTLVVGILCFFGLGFVAWVVDFVTTITNDKITILAD